MASDEQWPAEHEFSHLFGPPTMSPFNSERDDPQKVVAQISKYIDERGAACNTIGNRLVHYFQDVLRDSINNEQDPSTIHILTLSSSSTFSNAILHVLEKIDQKYKFNISILESRPLFEGVTMASKLLSAITTTGDRESLKHQRLSITLVPDSSISHLFSSIEKEPVFVVLGADRISHSGAVSNKTGSLPLVLTARDVASRKNLSLQVVVLSETEKVAKYVPSQEESEEENDGTELVEAWRKSHVQGLSLLKDEIISSIGQVKVVNKYFEWVAAEHIDVYLSENGPLTLQQIEERSEHISELEKEIFQDLK